MKNDIYLAKLIKQFKTVRGIADNINFEEFKEEFQDWLFHMQIQRDEYARFICKSDIYFDDESYAEIGKGPKDSVAILYEDKDTTIISPYFENYLSYNTYRKFINSSFSVIGSIPNLAEERDGKLVSFDVIYPEDIKVFMTHNPYNINDVKNWIELHNNPKNGIIIGMFGRTYDKDYQEKVKFMESLRQSTNIPYNLESHTIGDKYFYVFNTDICEKEKKYIKKR